MTMTTRLSPRDRLCSRLPVSSLKNFIRHDLPQDWLLFFVIFVYEKSPSRILLEQELIQILQIANVEHRPLEIRGIPGQIAGKIVPAHGPDKDDGVLELRLFDRTIQGSTRLNVPMGLGQFHGEKPEYTEGQTDP